MDVENIREYCLLLPFVTEDFPFDESTLVFRVGNKIFALLDLDKCETINLKCNPELAIDLRERYSAVIPGYHMNKKHWNTIIFNQDFSDEEIFKSVEHSYRLIFNSLTKKKRDELQNR